MQELEQKKTQIETEASDCLQKLNQVCNQVDRLSLEVTDNTFARKEMDKMMEEQSNAHKLQMKELQIILMKSMQAIENQKIQVSQIIKETNDQVLKTL